VALDHLHVEGGGSRVFGSDVAAAQSRDEVAELAVEEPAVARIAPSLARLACDQTLSPAPPEPRQRRFPSHSQRQSQTVAEEGLQARVGQVADTALGLAPPAAVQEGPEERARARTHLQQHRFVPAVVESIGGQEGRQLVELGDRGSRLAGVGIAGQPGATVPPGSESLGKGFRAEIDEPSHGLRPRSPDL
jgi:hypothetical protein